MQRPPAHELEVAVDEPRGVECIGLYPIEYVNGKPILCEQPLSGLDGASVLVIRLESPGFQFHADGRRLGVALACWPG
ncbi:MAG: hypothetical protein AB1749_08820 [Pseudomonadota bacterium]